MPEGLCEEGDGVADSIWLLQTIIRQHTRTLQPLNIAFLDIKKAFDSLSHESLLLLATARMRVPSPMLGYLGVLYRDGRSYALAQSAAPLRRCRGELDRAVLSLSISSTQPLIGLWIASIQS